MMDAVRASLEERDLFIYLVDATKPFSSGDEKALSILRQDGAARDPRVEQDRRARGQTRDCCRCSRNTRSATNSKHIFPSPPPPAKGSIELRDEVIRRLPEGPEYFPPDHFTDQPARFLAAELIREKILLATRQEVPHSVTVLIEKWEELPRLIRIFATILVERDGQKAIVIGSKGSMLKQIGTLAREEMEALFDTHIYLDLHVKVEAAWREKAAYLNTVDWRTMSRKR